ncbi:hypothetical protein BHE74_00034930 [Ensete ventricosum]|nr:hypothetical protein BHE74_00034930 [Ensete ventricosum]
MRLGTRQECVGSSSRVSGVCQDGAREFTRRRPRLAGRLSGEAEKLAGTDGLRSSLGIGLGLDNAVGSHRSSLGDSLKGLRSSLGTRREIARRRPEDLPQEYRRPSDWRELGLDYLDWSLSVVITES